MPQVRSQEELEFLRDLETRRGASVGYRTFSTFYADSDGNVRDFGVFFYQCQDRFWYEDFDHEPTFLGIKLRPRRGDYKYEKFEASFSPLEVVSIRKVVKSKARNCALGYMSFEKLKEANPVLSFFRETVTEFRLSDGRQLFFQLLDKTVQNMIEKYKNENK